MTRHLPGLLFTILFALVSGGAMAQPLKDFDAGQLTGPQSALPAAMPALARVLLAQPGEQDPLTRMRLHLLAGEPQQALASIAELRALHARQQLADAELGFTPFELYARAMLAGGPIEDSFRAEFRQRFKSLGDAKAWRAGLSFTFDLEQGEISVQQSLARLQANGLTRESALDLIRNYQPQQMFARLAALPTELLDEDEATRYTRQQVLVKALDGASLSAYVVLPRNAAAKPQPTAMVFTIYAEAPRPWTPAVQAASQGFAGVVAFSRGKAGSPDKIAPYEHEVTDVNAVIAWIARQPWSDGRVGMYGGSYNGFSQWAALKNPHPALKTIVPYVAAIPGLGLPMENNVFLNANYGWAFYVGNNAFLDNKVYNDRARWNALGDRWFESGRPYREIDAVDGTPNAALQRWLAHPAFDAYWQSMVPWGADFARIGIPVLSITGYYDDGQISAIEYLKQHERHRPGAPHYLVIGPYDHVGAQNYRKPPNLRGYAIDAVAQLDTPALTFEWLNHILRGGPRPALLKDRINFQIMGTNRWGQAPSLRALEAQAPRKFYLTGEQMLTRKPKQAAAREQRIDFKDRKTAHNDAYYPSPIVSTKLETGNGLVFTSEPLQEAATLAVTFSGELRISINKRDVDLGVVLYELTAEGKYVHLSYFLGRASYAQDMSRRKLLTPGRITTIPFHRTRMVARELKAGSRLVAVLNVNKNSGAQLNQGTSREVSDESIADAGEPLVIRWHNDSYLSLPMLRSSKQ